MFRINRALAGFGLGAALVSLSACTVVNGADMGSVSDGTATGVGGATVGPDGELLDTGLPFVNTGSVLFPIHKIGQEDLAAQMEAYLNSFEDFLPKALYVSRTDFVRSGPGNFYEPLRLVKSWDTVMVDGKSGSWYRLADRTGFFPGGKLIDLMNPTGFVWELEVVNSGTEEQIDACLGGLTDFLPMSEDLGIPVWSMHGNCGGESAYGLEVNDVITVDGDKYQVTSHNLLPLFSSTEAIRDLADQDALLQVCDLVQGYSHIIGLKGIS